jgi:hypothetical protein
MCLSESDLLFMQAQGSSPEYVDMMTMFNASMLTVDLHIVVADCVVQVVLHYLIL